MSGYDEALSRRVKRIKDSQKCLFTWASSEHNCICQVIANHMTHHKCNCGSVKTNGRKDLHGLVGGRRKYV